MEDKIKRVMSNVFEVEKKQINNSSSIKNIKKWDSLSHINLIITLEKEFKTEFSSDEIVAMVSFNGIHKILIKKET